MDEAIFAAASLTLVLTGLYFVVRIWAKWRYTDKDVLKARVFLDKKFLENNWIFVFLSGATMMFNQMLSILPQNYRVTKDWIYDLSGISELAVLLFLTILCREWFVLMQKK